MTVKLPNDDGNEEMDSYEEDLQVGDLEIDRQVQRQGLNSAKVERMVKSWNPNAQGKITVSYRHPTRTYVVVDGQHRVEAIRRLTDNAGTVPCIVFKGLTLAQEAQMFLDLNHTTVPPKIDKFKVQQKTEGEEGDSARSIVELVGAYGWTVSRTAANGHVNAVSVLERLYALSNKIEADPNLIQVTMLVITRAWGNDRFGVQAPILEGIGRMFAEYGSLLETDRLITVLKEYKGGPQTLTSEASQVSALRKGKVSMGVADILVNSYNKGRRSKTLAPWTRRA